MSLRAAGGNQRTHMDSLAPERSPERTTVAFILSTRRAGSTWLNIVLGSHPWAVNLGEYARIWLMPGHVACRLCEADGLPECDVFAGVGAVPVDDAFGFAARRFPGRTIVDASKQEAWCARFLGRDDLDVRVIHLVRHPAGYLESELRRRPETPFETILAEWQETNERIEAFVTSNAIPHRVVSYEELTERPGDAFPPLCEFLGGTYDPDTLQYWNYVHHGLGGNGAASLYLRGRKVVKYITGDDAYYEALRGAPTRPDLRWRERISADVIDKAESLPYAATLRELLRRD